MFRHKETSRRLHQILKNRLSVIVMPLLLGLYVLALVGCGNSGTNARVKRKLPEVRPAVSQLALSPDGKLLGAIVGNDIRIWEVPSGKELKILHTGELPYISMAFSADARRLAVSLPDKSIEIWDIADGKKLFSVTGHSAPAAAMAFTPDGKSLISGAFNPNPFSKVAELFIFDLDKKAVRDRLSVASGVTSLIHQPEHNRLILGHDDYSITLWDLEKMKQTKKLVGHKNSVSALALAPDGKTLVSGGKNAMVTIWDTSTWSKKSDFKGDDEWINAVAISPDGNLVASGGADRLVHVFDLNANAKKPSLNGHSNLIMSLLFTSDGKLVSGSTDGTIRVWDAATGTELKKLF